MASMLETERLLVIAPHADDEVFGCGGTIAKLKDQGAQVYVLVVSVGEVQHYGADDKTRVSAATSWAIMRVPALSSTRSSTMPTTSNPTAVNSTTHHWG